MKNYNFTAEHQEFRISLRHFLDKEVVPFVDEWEKQNSIPSEIWRKMGEMGYLGLNFPEKYGGLELDFYFSLIFCEEVSKCFSGGFSFSALIAQYIAAPYIYKYGLVYLKQKYLRPIFTGKRICAVALKDFSTEKEKATTARLEGDRYFVNGSKAFVVNGSVADFIITSVQTSENEISLLLIENKLEGLSTQKIDKVGWYAADVSDVFFDNVEVAQENLLGELGKGKEYEVGNWQLEKLVTSIVAVTTAEFALHYAMKYMNEREAFGRKINRFQVLRHRVAHMIAEIETVKEYAYYCCDLHNKGEYALLECAMVRLQATELACQVLDRSLQFFGGYGYTEEFKIARMYRDIQVAAVVGGTPEQMCRLISEITFGGGEHQKAHRGEDLSSKRVAKSAEVIQSKNNKVMETLEIIKGKAARIPALGKKLNIDLGNKVIHIDGTGETNWVSQENKAADCILHISEENLQHLFNGSLNAMSAMMSGKMSVEGDMGIAMKLQALLT